MTIKKALFPIAGMGTRFLPATKAMPKEMFPLVDTPIIEVLVEEVVKAGIEEIIFVTSREKPAIENHFDSFPALENSLREKGKEEALKKIKRFNGVKFTFVRQPYPLGDGHAISCARHIIGDEPFLVIFGDELLFGEYSSTSQLIEAYEQKKSCIIGVRKMPKEKISSYGVVKPSQEGITQGSFEINGVVEKPAPQDAPSDFAVIGKYVCTNEIWNNLENAGTSHGGEMRLIDGFEELLKSGKINACPLSGKRFDTGNPKGFLMANIYVGVQKGLLPPSFLNDLEEITV